MATSAKFRIFADVLVAVPNKLSGTDGSDSEGIEVLNSRGKNYLDIALHRKSCPHRGLSQPVGT